MTESTGAATNSDAVARQGTLEVYLRLIEIIHEHKARLAWSELAFTVLQVAVFFACAPLVIAFAGRPTEAVSLVDSTVILCGLAIGIGISAYWVARAMRLQLKLKLRYFQARYLERKLAGLGEDILSGEARFNKDRTALESPDGVETIVYPHKGVLRTDGFFGSARPRVLSVVMPGLFFLIFAALFVWVLAAVLAAAF